MFGRILAFSEPDVLKQLCIFSFTEFSHLGAKGFISVMSNLWPINAVLQCWQKQSMSGTEAEFLGLYLAVTSTTGIKVSKNHDRMKQQEHRKESLDQINAVVSWAGKR